jgi:two-component system phosphate regulon response regulator PhoB
MSKILVVEDDPAMAKELVTALEAKDFLVDLTGSGKDADAYMGAALYDLIILDWQLPDTTGIQICRKLRTDKRNNVPILMLTARAQVADKEEGFESGADDYLTKPFSMPELLARVKALLRRPPILKTKQITIRNLSMNVDTREVSKEGQRIDLLPKEFALLEFFMSHPNQIYTTDQVLRHVWPTDVESSPETLRVTMMRLRRKLDFPEDSPLIVTVRGVGYRLDQ